MKSFFVSAWVVLASSLAAQADCAAELARHQEGISKDGSHAPLETPVTGGEPAKDGTGMPMNTSPSVVTSSDDVEAQQKGGDTAAQSVDNKRSEALITARKALDAGNEEGCLNALKGLQ